MAWLDSMRKVVMNVANMAQGKTTNLYTTTYNAAQFLSQLRGLPVSSAVREFSTLWNNTIGEEYPSLNVKNIHLTEKEKKTK